MRRFTLMLAFLFGLAATPFAVHAQDEEDTMTPVSEDGSLPADEDAEAHDAAQFGLETAREARGLRNEIQEKGPDAGKEFGEGVSERAPGNE